LVGIEAKVMCDGVPTKITNYVTLVTFAFWVINLNLVLAV
jgi:hypothetical protein